MKIKPTEISKRGGFGNEIYEKEEFQEKVRRKFEFLKEDNWVEINGDQEISKVCGDITEKIEKLEENNKKNINSKLEQLWL